MSLPSFVKVTYKVDSFVHVNFYFIVNLRVRFHYQDNISFLKLSLSFQSLIH